ncbi:MAG: hypothetical protein HOP33_09025 [Verrucomicrobia bacterium]|nr:hypothetical protein [Verrucomicrobiota bacterium]
MRKKILPSALAAAVLAGAVPQIIVPQFANANGMNPLIADGFDTGRGYKPGQILFANDARFAESYYSEPLTNYLVGWKDPNDIEARLQYLAPTVDVGTSRRFEWKAAVNAEEFLSEIVDDQRAIGSDFKTVQYTGTDVVDKTFNKGLTYIADLDGVVGTNWQNAKVAKLMRRLFRNEYRRAVAAVSAGATNQAYTWDTTAGKNPDQDLRTDLITSTTASGIRPNRILYGDTAFNKRLLSYEAQVNATAYAGVANLSLEQLAARLMVDSVQISKERYQSAAAAKSEILSNLIFGFYAQDGVDVEDPSHVKRFVSSFASEQGGGRVRVYVQQISSKLVAITVEHYSKVVVTFSGGLRKWTIS